MSSKLATSLGLMFGDAPHLCRIVARNAPELDFAQAVRRPFVHRDRHHHAVVLSLAGEVSILGKRDADASARVVQGPHAGIEHHAHLTFPNMRCRSPHRRARAAEGQPRSRSYRRNESRRPAVAAHPGETESVGTPPSVESLPSILTASPGERLHRRSVAIENFFGGGKLVHQNWIQLLGAARSFSSAIGRIFEAIRVQRRQFHHPESGVESGLGRFRFEFVADAFECLGGEQALPSLF